MVRKSAPQKIPPAGGVELPSTGADSSRVGRRKAAAGQSGGPAKPRRPPTAVRVVGIGACAGGLAALQQLFGKLPADSELSFGKFVALSADRLRLSMPKPAGRRTSLPIDHFFGSLAAARGEQAIGVILSAAAGDGVRGVNVIKEAGGLTFAQSPAGAAYADMPGCASATRLIDFILPVDEIAARLTVVFQHPYLRDGTAVQASDDDLSNALGQILATLHTKTGHDVSGYKAALVHRRIARRMAVHQLQCTPDYLRVLNHDPREPDRLLQDMLTGVTGFFRDAEAYETLRDKVLIPLVLSRQAGGGLRIWVAGCSSGEEAYRDAGNRQ